jgi:hypothetical protein
MVHRGRAGIFLAGDRPPPAGFPFFTLDGTPTRFGLCHERNYGISSIVLAFFDTVAVRRAIKARQNALAEHSWKPSDQPTWLTSDLFSEKNSASADGRQSEVPERILDAEHSALKRSYVPVIRSSIGLSKCYASKIRQGYQPDPRHWHALAVQVGVTNLGLPSVRAT